MTVSSSSSEPSTSEALSVQWRKLSRQKNLFREVADISASREPQQCCGVSLAFLEAFANSVRDVRDERNDSTAAVLQRLVLPARMGRLWDFIPSQHTGQPQWYVVHAWAGSFQELVEVLLEELAPHGGTPRGDVMLWLDFFALNLGSTPGLGPGAKDVAEAVTAMEDAQAACGSGVVVALDRRMCALSRVWCLYELAFALRLHGMTRVHVAIPAELGVRSVEGLIDRFLSVDVCKSDAAQMQDKIDLLSKVRTGWGLQRTNRELAEGLSQALHCRLRWGGRPEDAAALAVMLLKKKELFQLQAHISSIFQKPDEGLIEDIFRMYDTDHSGDINEQELIAGLSSAGFSMASAIVIFRTIDTDHSDSITREEFQAYWESEDGKKVKEAMKQQRQDDFSMMGLQDNLEKIMVYMQEHELTEHFSVFRNLRSEVIFGQNMWAKLEPPVLLGNVTHTLCTVAEFYKTKDYRSSCAAMYELLMRNISVLCFHPACLQKPAGSDDEGQLLALYMSNLVRLLQHQGLKCHLECDFATCIMALNLEGWQGLQGFGGNLRFLKTAKDTMQMFSDVGVDSISRDQLDLANYLLNLVDEKRKKPTPGTAQQLLQQQQQQQQTGKCVSPGSSSKLLLASSFPSLSEFRAHLVKAGMSDEVLMLSNRTLQAGRSLRAAVPPTPVSLLRRASLEAAPSGGAAAAAAGASSSARRCTESSPAAVGGNVGVPSRRLSLEFPLRPDVAVRHRRATEQTSPGSILSPGSDLGAVMEEDGLSRCGSGSQASSKGKSSQSVQAMMELLAGLGGGSSNGGRAGLTSVRRRTTADVNLQFSPTLRPSCSHLSMDRVSSGPLVSEHATGPGRASTNGSMGVVPPTSPLINLRRAGSVNPPGSPFAESDMRSTDSSSEWISAATKFAENPRKPASAAADGGGTRGIASALTRRPSSDPSIVKLPPLPRKGGL